jgi:glycosyltransferase involved in cell wall biosynthesis
MFFRAITKHIALSAFAKASAIMVPSKEVKEMMAWNITRAKCVIVPLGIDTEKFVPPLNKSDAKRALGFNAEDMILGYVGRISREKDLLTLLSAFESVHAKFPNAKLVIVGDGIESIKSQLANKPNVFLMGAQSNVVPYVQAFDIYAHPSLLETTCLACLEAMSCGLPCVVTPVGLMKEYIVHNKNGYTFPLHNNLVLSLKIEALIEDDALRGEIGNNARQTVINEYSWVRTISKVRNILQTLEGPK